MRNPIAILGIIALFGSFANAGIQPASQPSASVNGASISPSDVTTSTLTTHAAYVKNDLTVNSTTTLVGNTTVSGNLGVGTASPSSKLEVNGGSVTIQGTNAGLRVEGNVGLSYATPQYPIDLGASATGKKIIVRSDAGTGGNPYGLGFNSSGFVNLWASGVLGLSEHYSGTIGIGTLETEAPLGRLNVKLNAADNYAVSVTSADSSYMGVWDKNGRLGIGTANPQASLDVAGGIGHYSRTIAQLLAIAPAHVGIAYFCNNCSPAKMVVSTGTSAGNFAAIDGGAFQ